MAVEAPSLPDARLGIIEVMKRRTDAGEKVHHTAGKSWRTPYILVEHAGSRELADPAMDQARLVFHCYGGQPDVARRVALQVRDVMMPRSRGPWGLKEEATYEDPNDQTQRHITFSGAFLESGPREAPDSRNRVIITYLTNYY